MPKKKVAARKRDHSLSPDYISVEYPATDPGTPFPVRGGARKPTPAEVEANAKPETAIRKGR